jgi:hypothetical protein
MRIAVCAESSSPKSFITEAKKNLKNVIIVKTIQAFACNALTQTKMKKITHSRRKVKTTHIITPDTEEHLRIEFQAPQRISSEYLEALRALEKAERLGRIINWFILINVSILVGVILGVILLWITRA